MTPRSSSILFVVVVCVILASLQTVHWWADAAGADVSRRVDAARLQQLAVSRFQRSLDGVRHELDQAALTTTLSGAVPPGALDRRREELTASLTGLTAVPGTAADRDIDSATASVTGFFREWDAFVAEAASSPASAAAHIAGARRMLQDLGTETMPRLATTIDAEVAAAQAADAAMRSRATIVSWAVFAAGVVAVAVLALFGRRTYATDAVPLAAPFTSGPVGVIPRAEVPVRAAARLATADDTARLHAIGRLAGGVAHDFNNLLTVIKGHMERLLESAGQGPTRTRLEEVQRAADRAAALTAQLLAFGQRQVLAPRVINLNDIVSDQAALARPLLDDRVDLLLDLDPGLWSIRADPAQCAQVIMNLVVNARDALTKGGRIVVRTANCPEGWRTETDRLISPAVEVSVSDNGIGMDDSVRAQIFEPFFTTKSANPPSGLGLSTVHGVVRQSGGDIVVTSAPGKGSTFTVILPAVAAESDTRNDDASRPGRTGRIPGILH